MIKCVNLKIYSLSMRIIIGCVALLFLFSTISPMAVARPSQLRPLATLESPQREGDLDARVKPVSFPAVQRHFTEQTALIDTETGLEIGSPTVKPFAPDIDLTTLQKNVAIRLQNAVLSVSGIREIFDVTLHDPITGMRREDPDGKTDDRWEGTGTEITDAAKVHVATIAQRFAGLVKRESGKQNPTIVMAMDTRHTGPAIADVMIRMLLKEGINVKFSSIMPIPEIMVWAKESRADGWIYVSASHNPRGHNGLKLGLTIEFPDGTLDTKIMPEDIGVPFRDDLKATLNNSDNTRAVIDAVNSVDPALVEAVYTSIPQNRQQSHEFYAQYSDMVATGMANAQEARQIKEEAKKAIEAMRLVVGLDPNGGARSKEEAEYWRSWGFGVVEINGIPREGMVRALAPTQESMELLSEMMADFNGEEAQKVAKDRDYRPWTMVACLRYDTDGDRKNEVFWNTGEKRPIAPGVQICFVLDAIARLMSKGIVEKLNPNIPEDKREVVVVVNDASSAVLCSLKDILGFKLRVAETGEANVTKAAELEAANGKTVVVIGEASNGGAFTLQLKVREPRFTVGTIVNFLTNENLVKEYLRRVGQEDKYRPGFNIADLIKTLPPSATTDFFSEKGEGDRRGLALPFKLFKDEFTDYVRNEAWRVISQIVEAYNPKAYFRYEIVNFERENIVSEYKRGEFKKDHSGGYRINIYCTETEGAKERLIAWMWFRPSATEAGVVRRGTSATHWINTPENTELVKRTQTNLDKLLTRAMDEAEIASAVEILFNSAEYQEEVVGKIIAELKIKAQKGQEGIELARKIIQKIPDGQTRATQTAQILPGDYDPLDKLWSAKPLDVILSDLDETAAPDRDSYIEPGTAELIREFVALGGEFGFLSTRDADNIIDRGRCNAITGGLTPEAQPRLKVYGRSGIGEPEVQRLIEGRQRLLSKEELLRIARQVWPEAQNVLPGQETLINDPSNPNHEVYQFGNLSVYVPKLGTSEGTMAMFSFSYAKKNGFISQEWVDAERPRLQERLTAAFPAGKVGVNLGGSTTINIGLTGKGDLIREKYLKNPEYANSRIAVVDDEGLKGYTGFSALSIEDPRLTAVLVNKDKASAELPPSVIMARRQKQEALNRLLEIEIAKRKILASQLPGAGANLEDLDHVYKEAEALANAI